MAAFHHLYALAILSHIFVLVCLRVTLTDHRAPLEKPREEIAQLLCTTSSEFTSPSNSHKSREERFYVGPAFPYAKDPGMPKHIHLHVGPRGPYAKVPEGSTNMHFYVGPRGP